MRAPAPGSATRFDGPVLALTALIGPPLAVYAPLGMAPLAAVAGLLVLIGDSVTHRGWPKATFLALRDVPLLRAFALLSLAIVTWGLASASWAVDADKAIEGSGQLAGIVIAAVSLIAAARRCETRSLVMIARAIIAGVVLALIFLALERLSGGFLKILGSASSADERFSFFNRAIAVLLLFSMPALFILLRRPIVAGLTVAAIVIAVFAFYGSSLQIALIAGLFFAALTWIFSRIIPAALAILLAAGTLAAPLLPSQVVPRLDLMRVSAETGNVSIAHRLIIWQFSAARIAEKPLTGWGMNAARAIPGGKERVALLPPPANVMGERLPLHTHNAPLQWWLELGLPGALLMIGLWLVPLLAIHCHAPGRTCRAIATGGYVTAFGIAALGYGAWQSWWLSALAIAAALSIAALTATARERVS